MEFIDSLITNSDSQSRYGVNSEINDSNKDYPNKNTISLLSDSDSDSDHENDKQQQHKKTSFYKNSKEHEKISSTNKNTDYINLLSDSDDTNDDDNDNIQKINKSHDINEIDSESEESSDLGGFIVNESDDDDDDDDNDDDSKDDNHRLDYEPVTKCTKQKMYYVSEDDSDEDQSLDNSNRTVVEDVNDDQDVDNLTVKTNEICSGKRERKAPQRFEYENHNKIASLYTQDINNLEDYESAIMDENILDASIHTDDEDQEEFFDDDDDYDDEQEEDKTFFTKNQYLYLHDDDDDIEYDSRQNFLPRKKMKTQHNDSSVENISNSNSDGDSNHKVSFISKKSCSLKKNCKNNKQLTFTGTIVSQMKATKTICRSKKETDKKMIVSSKNEKYDNNFSALDGLF